MSHLAAATPLAPRPWGDFDGDGKLDLFVPGYVHYDIKSQLSDTDGLPLSFCSYRGVRAYCGPRGPFLPSNLTPFNGSAPTPSCRSTTSSTSR